jgi:DNA modification methylase
MKVQIGEATLYLGDCMDILPTLDKVDAVITDPPYGINKDGQIRTKGGHGGRKAYEFLGWDGERPEKAIFDLMLEKADCHVIWGGNYFADWLPATMRWLVWDKGQRINQSDGELAWTSMQSALRICIMNRVELLTDGAQHPTQKPVPLLEYLIKTYTKENDTVLDNTMGSGSTGVACKNTNRSFIGIEKDENYFKIAEQRINARTLFS